MKYILQLIIILVVLSSCSTKRQILYFQDSEFLDQQELTDRFEPIIEPNDILFITISSLNEEVVKPFIKNKNINTNVAPSPLQGYLVNNEGNIRFPVLGDVTVKDKSRSEVEELLKTKLSVYVKDVVVDVRIQNFKVTVLGEVNNPGVIELADDRVTLPQAIGQAGDFSEDGKRTDVMVIREENGKQVVARIDFTSTDFFNSPYYFLKQNDIVYVEPSLKGVKKSGFISNLPSLLSLFTIILSSVVLLTR